MPSPSLSNPWGSGDKTVKLFCRISGQFMSGGEDGMQKSGYDESQPSVVVWPNTRLVLTANEITRIREQIPTLTKHIWFNLPVAII